MTPKTFEVHRELLEVTRGGVAGVPMEQKRTFIPYRVRHLIDGIEVTPLEFEKALDAAGEDWDAWWARLVHMADSGPLVRP